MVDFATIFMIQHPAHSGYYTARERELAGYVSRHIGRDVSCLDIQYAALINGEDRYCTCAECERVRQALSTVESLYFYGDRTIDEVREVLTPLPRPHENWVVIWEQRFPGRDVRYLRRMNRGERVNYVPMTADGRHWVSFDEVSPYQADVVAVESAMEETRRRMAIASSIPISALMPVQNISVSIDIETTTPLSPFARPTPPSPSIFNFLASVEDEVEEEETDMPDECCDCSCEIDEDNVSPCRESHCKGCCNCFLCASCSRWFSRANRDQCSECNECSRCCDCRSCSGCGDRTMVSRMACSECGRCDDCECRCRSNDGNDEFLREGMLRFWQATPKEYKVNKSHRFISLEIEVQSASGRHSSEIDRVSSKWNDSIVEDGSLRSTGFEINTNPTSGDKFIEHIEETMDALNYAEAVIDSDCGMHCHVGAGEFKYLDLYKLCKLYCRVENAMFRLVDQNRRGGSYSRVSQIVYNFDDVKFQDFRRELNKRMYAVDPNDKSLGIPNINFVDGTNRKKLYDKTEKYLSIRYYALNLHSFFLRGTIEFRHHQGCLDATRAVMWGRICAAVVDAAAHMSIKQIEALPASTTQALFTILPEDVRKWASANVRPPKKRDNQAPQVNGEIY